MRIEKPFTLNYDDIINLPHHVSKNHPQMSMRDRAAQFAPFAALTGYEGVIDSTTKEVREQMEQTNRSDHEEWNDDGF